MFEKLTAFMDGFLEAGVPGYDCIVYKDGKEVYRHFNGYADLERKIPMTGKEFYNIYSCSKPITVVAALQLYEKGLYDLDDELAKYLPEFHTMYVKVDPSGSADGENIQPAKCSIKIRDLFCMRAGFSYNVWSDGLKEARTATDGKCPTRETMKYLAKDPLLFHPGDRYEYSLCHDVLAALVEVLSGERFGDYVKKHIFDPLGMQNSTFWLPDEKLDILAQQYVFDAQLGKARNCGKHNQGYKLGSEYESGGAGGISTVEDYIKFLEALRVGDVILKKETIDLMTTNQLTEAQMATYTVEKYGYGLGVRCPIGYEEATDFGWGGAAGAWLCVDRTHSLTIYFGMHLLCSPVQEIRSRIKAYVLEEYGQSVQISTQAKNLTY